LVDPSAVAKQCFDRGRVSKADRVMERRDAVLIGLVNIRARSNGRFDFGSLRFTVYISPDTNSGKRSRFQ
jgi:hypothetical protein